MEATNRKWRVAQSHKYCEKGKGGGWLRSQKELGYGYIIFYFHIRATKEEGRNQAYNNNIT